MAMGGETVDQARGTASMMNVPPENGDADAGGGAVFSRHADVEKKLARFAEVAASNPNAACRANLSITNKIPTFQYIETPPRISPELEGVLWEISSTGVPYYRWGGLKELLAARMLEVVAALEEEAGFHQGNGGKAYTQRRDDLLASLRKFEAAPFTLQRLAEILQDPRRQYSSTHKLINGLERLLSVSSTLPLRTRTGVVRPAVSSTSDSSRNATRTEGEGDGIPSPSGARANGVTSHLSHGTDSDTSVPSSGGDSGGGGDAYLEAANSNGDVGVRATAREGGGRASPTVSVKVEAGVTGVASKDALTVKTQMSQDLPDETVADDTADGRGVVGPGRKRLKMELKSKAAVLSE